jgi:hypothetical protein
MYILEIKYIFKCISYNSNCSKLTNFMEQSHSEAVSTTISKSKDCLLVM